MKVLAADGFILCRGLVRTLMLLDDQVSITRADSIVEVLASLPLLPDLNLILLDTQMPGMENFAGLKQTIDMVPHLPVVVISPSESRASILAAVRHGAKGYFSLSTKLGVLEHALPLILAGECYVPACALRPVRGQSTVAPEVLPRWTGSCALSSRQYEIMDMLAQGKSNKEIARQLNVLEGTVKLHVKGILRKLGVKNRTEAVLVAARAGYLSKGVLGTGAPLSNGSPTGMPRIASGAGPASPASQPRARPKRPAGASRPAPRGRGGGDKPAIASPVGCQKPHT
jgi:two-component system, NarL family, nitrate/nitrite response regulator NarL